MPESREPGEERVVVTAIVTSDAGVLLCRRHDGEPEWSFPGGRWEAGETARECAARETAEETGLAIEVGDQLGRRVHPKTGRVIVYFAARAEGDDRRVRVGDPDEHAEGAWVSWAEARERLSHLFGPVAEHLERTLGA